MAKLTKMHKTGVTRSIRERNVEQFKERGWEVVTPEVIKEKEERLKKDAKNAKERAKRAEAKMATTGKNGEMVGALTGALAQALGNLVPAADKPADKPAADK